MAPLKSFLLVSGLASALSCTTENCEAGDQTALLQSHLSRKSDLSLTSTGAAFFPRLGNLNDPHTRKSALLEIEKTAMKLASQDGPVEDVVVTVCTDTAEMLNATVLYAIIEEDAVDRAQLASAYADFDQHEVRRQAAQDAIEAAEALVAQAANALTMCRTQEQESCINVTECHEHETGPPCSEWEECWNCDHCSETEVMAGTASLCCYDREIHNRWCEGEGADAVIRQETIWRTETSILFNHYNNAHLQCEQWRENCTIITEVCESVVSRWHDIRTDCHTKMSLWQSASCSYHHEVSGALELYQQGFLITLGIYNDIVAHVMIDEADRKVEWEVLTRVICLLLSLTIGQGEAGAVSSDDNKARIDLCWTQAVDTTHLDIDYLPPPDMLGLPVLPPWPCDSDYLHTDPIFSPPAVCAVVSETHGHLATSECICTANQVEDPGLSLGHFLLVDPSITLSLTNSETTWNTVLADGTTYSGAVSPIHHHALPTITEAFFTPDDIEDGNQDGNTNVEIAGMAWGYGTSDTITGAASLEQRFAQNGGLLFLNDQDQVVAVRQLAPSSTNLNQDIAAYMSFQTPQELNEVQFASACPTPQVVTDGWYLSRGAETYCWVMGTLDMCDNGCFAYQMQGNQHLVFPLIEGLYVVSTGSSD